MKNKNIVIILCLFLAIAIAGAVFVFNKPAKPEKPGNNNNQQTSIQENIKEENGNTRVCRIRKKIYGRIF